MTSSSICSSVQKMWASSCVMWRTRSRPCSVPLGSWRGTRPASEEGNGRARGEGRRASRLWALREAGLGVADRQVAVRAALVLVYLHVRRAVHGLEAHRPALDVREVHVVAVHRPMARLLPQLDVVEDRRLDLAVVAARVLLAPEGRQLVPDRHPVRLPERRAGRQVAELEELELRAQFAMVAGARLLEQLQVLL